MVIQGGQPHLFALHLGHPGRMTHDLMKRAYDLMKREKPSMETEARHGEIRYFFWMMVLCQDFSAGRSHHSSLYVHEAVTTFPTWKTYEVP